MVIDTGSDYTLLPYFLLGELGINAEKDCQEIEAQGVGGKTKVYLLKKKLQIKIGEFERKIPVGFLPDNSIPPLLGREEFFETFRVIFDNYQTTFSKSPKSNQV